MVAGRGWPGLGALPARPGRRGRSRAASRLAEAVGSGARARPGGGRAASSCRCGRKCPRRCSARARPRSSALALETEPAELVVVDAALTPGAAAQSRADLEDQGHRPDRPDPRDLRRARPDPRGRAAGRARRADLPALAAGPFVDPSRAAAWRLRLPGRSRREPARARPPADHRADRPDQAGAGRREADARPASRGPQAGALSGGGAGRLHQCRQVDPVQPPDRRRRSMRATRCSPRSIRPCARSRLPSGANAILSDTVGFITDLPTSLVAAFRATLEEVLSADLIVHVRDISHPDTEAQKRDVETVLTELGIDAEDRAARMVEAWNKIDLLSPGGAGRALGGGRGQHRRQPALRGGRHRACAPAGGRGPAARGEPDRGRARPGLQLRRDRGLAAPARRGARAHRRRHRPSSQGCNRGTRASPARPQARPAGLARSSIRRANSAGNPRKSRLRKTAACEWGRKRLKSGVVGGTPETQPHSALRLIWCQQRFLKSR